MDKPDFEKMARECADKYGLGATTEYQRRGLEHPIVPVIAASLRAAYVAGLERAAAIIDQHSGVWLSEHYASSRPIDIIATIRAQAASVGGGE